MDNQARETQIATAQNNPSIVSPLSGAPTQSDQMTPPPQQASSVAGFPSVQQASEQLSSRLYGGSFLPAATTSRDDMLKQLFTYDQELERGYSPFPQVPGYVENPADLYRAGAGYAGGVGQSIGTADAAIAATERGYQTAVGGVLDKLVSLLQMQEDRRSKEEDRKMKEKELEYQKSLDEREFLMTMAKLSGGSFTDPISGKTFRVPAGGGGDTAGERESSRVFAQIEDDSKNGVPIEDVIRRYGDSVGYNDILRIYNKASTYGPAQKGDAFYRGIYDTLGKSTNPDPSQMTFQDRIDALEGKEKTDIANYSAALADMTRIKNQLETVTGEPSFIQSLAQDSTGPIAGRSPLGSDQQRQLRTELDKLKEGIRKDLYGTSFTATEKSESSLPGSKVQEEQNRRRLQSLITSKENELRYRLKTAGWTDQEVETYLETIRGKQQSSGGSFEIIEEP